jgi:hypothetical protein
MTARTERERDVLERSVQAISEKVRHAYALVDEISDAGVPPDHRAMVMAKTLRFELVQIKSDLERELGHRLLDCVVCKRRALGVRDGGRARPLGALGAGTEASASSCLTPH